jgi:hypothetical protein
LSSAPTEKTLLAFGLARWHVATPGQAVVFGLAIAAALVALRLVILFTLGVLGDSSLQDHRIALVVALLTGFTVATAAYGRTALQRDIETRRRLLGWSPAQMSAVASRYRIYPTSAFLTALLVAPVGLFLVTSHVTSRPFLLADDPWTVNVVWSLVSNLLLFGVIGLIGYLTYTSLRLSRELDAVPYHLDLLDLSSVKHLASAGLRLSFFWLGGSSLASLLFLDLDFSWMIGVVVAVSLCIGTWLFVAPLWRLAQRIDAEKERELAKVRERIRSVRDGVLVGEGPTDVAAASLLPALLAYEHRITAVREWLVDVSSLVRFITLLVLAVGSWLGGALTDRAVDTLLR